MILIRNNIIPPKEWLHDINLENKYNESIKSLLLSSDRYIY